MIVKRINNTTIKNALFMNGPEYVDLGLPSGTLWATCNIGATKMTESGDYFAWGDISPKENYVGRTCRTYDIELSILKRYINLYNVLCAEYDAAACILGGKWRMPSGEQAQELIKNCNWEWINNYDKTGVNGRLGVSKINDASIFLPAAGYAHNSDILMVGNNGGYWTGSPNLVASNRAWSIAFDSHVINVFDHGFRYRGYSIRPVLEQ